MDDLAVAAREMKPIWTSSSFLVYAGGLTVLVGALSALAYLSSVYGSGAKVGWALLLLVILYGIAHALRLRDRPLAAGIFAFASVIAWGAFVISTFEWWGWNGVNAPTNAWSWSKLAAVLLILAAAWDDRRRFRFPFIRLISALLVFVLVLTVLPAGGGWTAAWALIVGLVYLFLGNVVDKPSAFWLHLVGGGLIGYAVLKWFHTSDGDFAVVLIVSLVYVWIAHWTRRSSWAVLGTIGFFVATIHYIIGSATVFAQSLFGLGAFGGGCNPRIPTTICQPTAPNISPWAPALGLGLLGLWLVLLGILGRRRHAPVVVAEPAPPAE
jgi:hypothetical protein